MRTARSIREERQASIIEALRGAARLSRERFPTIREIILFGSFARGDWSLHSDVDIAVVLPEELNANEVDEIRQFFSIASDREVDVIPLKPEWREAKYSLLAKEIEKFGKAL